MGGIGGGGGGSGDHPNVPSVPVAPPPVAPVPRASRSSRWPGIVLRSTVFATVFLAALWVSPALKARYFGTNVEATYRRSVRSNGRVIVEDGDLSWAMAKKPVRTQVPDPYVPDGPPGTAFTEHVGNGTITVTIWDLPGTAPLPDDVLRQYELTDRNRGGQMEVRSVKFGASRIPGRLIYRSMDHGLPTSRSVDLIAAVVPASGSRPARLLLLASVRPSAGETVNGLTPPEAQDVAWDEFNAVRSSFERS